jgi:hypothetical protein
MLTAHATSARRDNRRFRLATNDNEIVVNGLRRLPPSDSVADDELDTEGHRLATNDNETVVNGARRATPADEGDEPPLYPSGRRR